MSRLRWLSLALVATAGLAAVANLSCTTRQTGTRADTTAAVDTLARGKYVATITGCGDCHTPGALYGSPDWNRTLAGSELAWRGPWGVSYPRNLTPDPETGIGSWTREQIVVAVRTGRRPDGRMLLPPMPWPDFSAMTDEDAYALASYLKSLPPIVHRVPDPLAPGKPARGSILILPPPSTWDAPRTPPAGQAPGAAPGAADTTRRDAAQGAVRTKP